ncbi:hypothetical protein FA95DRAFT_1684455, partial [Auriscalpium vulgare]
GRPRQKRAQLERGLLPTRLLYSLSSYFSGHSLLPGKCAQTGSFKVIPLLGTACFLCTSATSCGASSHLARLAFFLFSACERAEGQRVQA